MHELGTNDGDQPVYSMQDGLVVVSEQVDVRRGWGESVIIATKTNSNSDEILTYHYHHLHYSGNSQNDTYQTSRLYNACEKVQRGAEIAREGGSGGWPVHLHVSIRRWKNFADLTAALQGNRPAIYGHGYTLGNDSLIANFLDPKTFVYDRFRDYNVPNQSNNWSETYVDKMRWYGIEFGKFDGNFGRTDNVLRREISRWIKIAAEQYDFTPITPTFQDMPLSDSDSPYIESLLRYPSQTPVLNPGTTCQSGSKMFCPDSQITRAAALKMVILAFYWDQYFANYSQEFWLTDPSALQLWFYKFQDVSVYDWFASYVYAGVGLNIVANQPYFRPGDPISREEISKWIIDGYEHINAGWSSICTQVTCPQNYYCDPAQGYCKKIPICISTEESPCQAGGGYDGCKQNPQCGSGQIQAEVCTGGGVRKRTCADNCSWNDWSNCDPNNCTGYEAPSCGKCGNRYCQSDFTLSDCINERSCNSGEIQTTSCNYNGSQNRVCQNDCTWGSLSSCTNNPVCIPNQIQTQQCNSGLGSQTRECDSSGQWGSWNICKLTPVCWPGQTSYWYTCYQGSQVGKKIRVCNANGQWPDWSDCVYDPLQPECTPSDIQERSCSVPYSTQTRTCDQNGFWSTWGSCYDNAPFVSACIPGVTQSQFCVNGTATQSRYCVAPGLWTNWGDCIAQCNPGETQTQQCSVTNGLQTRTCSGLAAWGNWGDCIEPAPVVQDAGIQDTGVQDSAEQDAGIQQQCTPGDKWITSCFDGYFEHTSATQYQVCSIDGSWSNVWSECIDTTVQDAGVPDIEIPDTGDPADSGDIAIQDAGTITYDADINDVTQIFDSSIDTLVDSSKDVASDNYVHPSCICTSGVCCDGCNYKPSSEPCNLNYVYQCQGTNKGNDVQKAMVKCFCSGSNSACTGQSVQYGWQTDQDCSTSQVCKVVNGTPQCQGTCTDTFTISGTSACNSNSSSSGSPTLCMEIQGFSSANGGGQYRICKQGGTFGNNFSYYLKDENNLVFFATQGGTPGASCSNWQSFSLSYISAYGAMNGAGLTAFVTSPTGCTQSACQYRTGSVTATKTCQQARPNGLAP